MANKRVQELVAITADELSPSDLLLLADVAPNPESKKLALSELSSYLLSNGNLSGSFYGTASWTLNAVSASWAPYQISASYASTSSWAWRSITSSYALAALSASWANSSSYAITASYAITSSVQLIFSSAYADFSRSSSYLIYTPGVFNGTASYALTSSRSITSLSSSFLNYSPLVSNGTASNAASASQAISSSFLVYTGNPNGTASYALSTPTASNAATVTWINNSNIYREYGPYDCSLVSSDTTASIGAITINSNANVPAAIIEAWGDIKLTSTSSNDTSSLTLNLWDVDFLAYDLNLDVASYKNYNTGSQSSLVTSSLIVPVYLKGRTTIMGHFSASIYKQGAIEFYTGSRPFRISVKLNSDDFTLS